MEQLQGKLCRMPVENYNKLPDKEPDGSISNNLYVAGSTALTRVKRIR
jgi:hypothetical protein